jgi:hypothetical protein
MTRPLLVGRGRAARGSGSGVLGLFSLSRSRSSQAHRAGSDVELTRRHLDAAGAPHGDEGANGVEGAGAHANALNTLSALTIG